MLRSVVGSDMCIRDRVTIKEGDKVDYEEGEGIKGKAATKVELA